jgi:pimeloyl-ACP methyl ester carboxylesterase
VTNNAIKVWQELHEYWHLCHPKKSQDTRRRNTTVIKATETFGGTFPFAPHYSNASGFKMHYVDEGEGSPILCLHGEPTWGYLYREIIPILAKKHRVIVPDYMGFGKSETPHDREYTTKEHTDSLERLVEELDLRDLTLVVHDWGGQMGGALALRQHERITRIVVMNTVLSIGMPGDVEMWEKNGTESAWFGWANRAVADNTFEPTLRNSGVAIVGLMKLLQGFQRSNVDENFFRAYSSQFDTPEECEGVIAFPKMIVTGTRIIEEGTPEAVAAVRAKPAIMIEGMRDKVLLAKYFIPMFEEAFPGAPIHRLETASHFLQEDEPTKIAELILEFSEQSSKA